MPHQCLKCGKIFPSGSPEILKGCGDCGGKKFFYTEQPVSEEERTRLTEQANKDIKVLIHEVLSQHQGEPFQTFDSEGHESSPGTGLGGPGSGWVKIAPKKQKASPKASKEAKAKEGPPEAETMEIKDHASVKQLLNELRTKTGEDLEPGTEVLEEHPIARTRPKKKGKVKLKRKKRVGIRKTGHRPEVIKVVEPGVYEIYLSKLLKHFPIVINKDGTYLVHLPSLFDGYGKEK
jgi:predicted  nucleic acid-binding Zn-ribbon protein